MKRTHSGSVLDFSLSPAKRLPYEYVQLTEYPCFSALPKDDESPLEFRIDKTDAFVDLTKSFVEIEMQILKKDGTELRTELAPGPGRVTITKAYNVAPSRAHPHK